MNICENCGNKHDGSYATGRFCNKHCSNAFSSKKYSKSDKEFNCIICNKIIIKTKRSDPKIVKCEDCKKKIAEQKKLVLTQYKCEKCNEIFFKNFIRIGRKMHCDKCIRKVKHCVNIKDIKSILELSKRSVSKILKRANTKCSICRWNEAVCDIHHIKSKKNKGTNDIDNLIIVCPNCHRIIHSKKKYSEEYLKEKNISITLNNWKDFYHPSN